MKQLLYCLVLVMGFAQPGYLSAQDVQLEEIYLGSISSAPIESASTPSGVMASGVFISDRFGEAQCIIDYRGGQTWYMEIVVVNWNSTSKAIKLEYDLRYADGAGYYVYRKAVTIPKSTFVRYRINVTPYIAKLGPMALAGRVYGTGIGNENRVTSQLYVY